MSKTVIEQAIEALDSTDSEHGSEAWEREKEAMIALEKLAAHPAPEIAIADAYRAGVDSGIAAEREACAKVCDDWAKTSYLSEAKSCAKIIRDRSNT